ncbi:MAG: 50S ribosomal protein L29 [Paludibacteraceae bacterium]|nr:50S ribosomal protein L29 [Paludibacteraceae bacterium]
MNKKYQEIVGLNDKELQERIEAEKANLSRMRLAHAISPLENPSQIQESRRLIARLATELRQRELNNKN